MQSYYVSIGHASFFTWVLVPSVLEPITLIFESSCSVSFLSDILHALACACKGDVHWGEIFWTTMLLVACLCLTFLYDATENSVLHFWRLHLTSDVQVEKDAVKYLNLNFVCCHIAELFGSCLAIAIRCLNTFPTLVGSSVSICLCLPLLLCLLCCCLVIHGCLVVVWCLFHSLSFLISSTNYYLISDLKNVFTRTMVPLILEPFLHSVH